jgi:hypothetical protein
MASRGKPKGLSALGYSAFLFQASELVCTTIQKNYETLREQTMNAKHALQATAQNKDIQDNAFIYMQKIRRHGSQPDRNTLSAIVLQWQTHSSISQREEELTVRILNTMHKNHCDYLKFTDILKRDGLEQGNIQDAPTQRTPQQKNCLVWCSPVAFDTFRVQEERLSIELDPVGIDGCIDLDHSIMLPQKEWNWCQDIEAFFV